MKRRALVVEDEADLALGLRLNLEAEGFEVEVAGDGDVALRRTREARFDVVLLDLRRAAQERLDAALGGARDVASEDAEEAFLRAYYVEKEVRDLTKAESAYAAIAVKAPADREIAARVLAGRMRCLRGLGRGAEAETLRVRLAGEFADTAAASAETKGPATGDLEPALRALHQSRGYAGARSYGDRAVPILAGWLSSQDPALAVSGSAMLFRIGSPAAREALRGALLASTTPHPDAIAPAALTGEVPDELLRRAAESKDAVVRWHALRCGHEMKQTPEWVYAAILGDAATLRDLLRGAAGPGEPATTVLAPNEAWARLLMRALVAGPGPARDVAVARLADRSNLRRPARASRRCCAPPTHSSAAPGSRPSSRRARRRS
jgi:CheY-like chemotaxis protein